MEYLIKFDENGRRGETYVADEKTQEEKQQLLDSGYEIISEADYQLLIGNVDGKEYVRTYDEAGNAKYIEYVPPAPALDELKAAKLAEVNTWTAAKITGGFVSACTGEPVTYDSDVETQLTVSSDTNTIALAPEEFAKHFPAGYPMRGYPAGVDTSNPANKQVYYLTASQLTQWNVDFGLHRGACKQAGWAKQAEVEAAQTVEELQAINL